MLEPSCDCCKMNTSVLAPPAQRQSPPMAAARLPVLAPPAQRQSPPVAAARLPLLAPPAQRQSPPVAAAILVVPVATASPPPAVVAPSDLDAPGVPLVSPRGVKRQRRLSDTSEDLRLKILSCLDFLGKVKDHPELLLATKEDGFGNRLHSDNVLRALKNTGSSSSTLKAITLVVSKAKPTALSGPEEQKIVEWLQESARRGFGRSKNQLITAVQTVLSKTPGRNTQFKNSHPGYKWYRGFMRRHAEQLTLRTPQALGAQQAAVSPEKIMQWFKTAESDIRKLVLMFCCWRVLVYSVSPFKPTKIASVVDEVEDLVHPVNVDKVPNCPTYTRMVRKYEKKEGSSRQNFSTSQAMVDAYNAVMEGHMSVNRASKHFGINKKSLLRRTNGEIPVNSHVGRQTTLSLVHETELAECIKLMAEWGWGFSSEEVKDIVQDFVSAAKLDTPFVRGRPERDWLEGYLSRHPDITPRKTEHLSSARASAEDPEVLKHWFEVLDNALTKAGVKDMPCQIFNADESGFVTDPKSQVVLATKGAKRVNQHIGESGREQITVNCCGSASGKVLPPCVIYKGKNLYEAWSTGGPAGACYTTSEKGWMEDAQFLDWFTKLFLTNTRDVSDKSRVLIFDGHLFHLSHALVQRAKENNVILLRLSAHLTHLLQPFDRAVFRPVKLKWQQLLVKFARTHSGPVGEKRLS
ncbi:hypothetical protein PoB_003483600 [Plakobranchus ocellatus]|uniref:HTH CENPB-type domain-containing protein n=1 Tax=Plakobranchus ocellatus TaxID=259542 RepID=A0AAV4AJ28_9GAST|nr:hypothetical protein PoB_003483600 [Plakobranchus ocellatus]